MDSIRQIAKELGIAPSAAEKTAALLDEGNSIPFIARYRKEVTGGLTDVQLREFSEKLEYCRNLEKRKEEILRLIEEQGKLTEALADSIRAAAKLQELEDLYKPYKQKRETRAGKARSKGLAPLADIILAQEMKSGAPETAAAAFVSADQALLDAGKAAGSPEEALSGALDILAEQFSCQPQFNGAVREKSRKSGSLTAKAEDPGAESVYEMYYDFREPLGRISNHRVLALNRGEKEGFLKVKLEAPGEEILAHLEREIIGGRKSIFRELLEGCIADSYKRLMAPSIERELRNELTERAEKDALKVFAKNTEQLLMAPPVKGVRVLALDPGYRTGCKAAVLDETGKLLTYCTIYPTKPKEDKAGAARIIKKLHREHRLALICIGNGTASRETEAFVAELLKEPEMAGVQYTIVSEAGASVYSASKLASEEYPDLDVTTRGAMSIGRRVQDPLAELVKIEPRHIGVGQYQHDLDQKELNSALGGVVENCVNRVGVDVNSASRSLLSYVAGINSGIAGNIVAYREENGPFKKRQDLKKVAKLGEKTFKQCAGFLRIGGGAEPLDSTAVHPESYGAARALLKELGCDPAEIGTEKLKDLPGQVEKQGAAALAEKLGVGVPTLKDIAEELSRPGRDPREDMPPVVFRKDILFMEDLSPGDEMMGTVRNVVDFGAFVDIGVKQDGLVHISELSHSFVRDPMDVVKVGDTVKVRVLKVDLQRKKISLSMKF